MEAVRYPAGMEAWIGLIGALAGVGVTLFGQYAVRKAEVREQTSSVILEQCPSLVALSEDFRNRVWEERRLGQKGVVANWDLGSFRVAEARLKILCRDKYLADALGALRLTGIDLGKAWRLPNRVEDLVETTWKAHKSALEQFISVSQRIVA